jgi:hypothetical protein
MWWQSVAVSGNGSPAITLGVYAHLFDRTGAGAAAAIERAMNGLASAPVPT